MIVIRSTVERGRVYRRCGCRDPDRRQLGTRSPRLADQDHGTWSFAVDFPAQTGIRNTVRRGGFADEDAARRALRHLIDGRTHGFDGDPNQTVAVYLRDWLHQKELVLKPTTFVRYRDYVRNDLIPGLGSIRLDDLRHGQITGFLRRQLKAGRGKTTLHRCLATLSSALTDAVRQRRLRFNPARPSIFPRPQAPERRVWTAEEAARFLEHCHQADPFMADLCETLIGTGMRRGEVLGLHWDDIHLDDNVLYVRHTLSAVDNGRLALTAPKTRASKNWIAISPRVAQALRRRRALAGPRTASSPSAPYAGLVFTRDDGRPLRPQTVLNRFRKLSDATGVPRITMHDLRHLGATLSIDAGVPLVVVSKTLRHSTISTTANTYSHLTRPAARAAVLAIQDALATAELGLTRAMEAPPLLWQGALQYPNGPRPALHPTDIDGIADEPETFRAVRALVSTYFSKARPPTKVERQHVPRLLIK